MRVSTDSCIVQGLLECIGGVVIHGEMGFISETLSLFMGNSIFIAAGASVVQHLILSPTKYYC